MNRANLAFWLNQIIGTLTFMIGVVACYFGALQQMPWLGMAVVMLVVLIDLLQNKKLIRNKIKLVVIVTLAAAVVETLLIVTSVYFVNPSSRLFDFQFVLPIWILALWVNFSIRIVSYLVFTRGKHLVNALLGIVFAVLIFRSAERFGLVELTYGVYSLAIIAAAWGVFVPFIYIFANRLFPDTRKK
ncbi:MAG: DUF2878 domain-containing protein [Porphyromonadaceae bacterium]|nr:DUF2878 domain-containing protein [Porphyromonadaceae bacterium]